MTATTVLFALLCIWLLVGVVCSVMMARRGHAAWTWGLLGALLGPLVIPAAISAGRHERDVAGARVAHAGHPGPGGVTVLVGLDGSADSEAAAYSARSMLGPQMGRVVLATVVDFDAVPASDRPDNIFMVEAKRLLDDAAELFKPLDPDRVVLTGRPSDALLEYARDEDIDLIVIGARGHGLAKTVLGSVAERIVRQQLVPVLIAGAPDIERR